MDWFGWSALIGFVSTFVTLPWLRRLERRREVQHALVRIQGEAQRGGKPHRMYAYFKNVELPEYLAAMDKAIGK